MKWAVTDTDLNSGIESLYVPEGATDLKSQQGRTRNAKLDARCFTRYKDQKELENDLKQNYKPWVMHPFTYRFRSEMHYRIFRKHYEIFVGGYLSFYDDITRNKATDHTIYCKWRPYSKKATDYWVQILMSPPPLKAVHNNGEVISKKGPGPAENDAVDPPKPPPPPPPSME
jgi:hypothetical protein